MRPLLCGHFLCAFLSVSRAPFAPTNTLARDCFHGARIHPITQKAYGMMTETMVYHFTVEEMKDYGPAVAVKFGAPASTQLEDLRVYLVDAVKGARARLAH